MLYGEIIIDHLVREATIVAYKLVLLYDTEIRSLADLLLASPNYALTKADIYKWADEHFQRKDLRESGGEEGEVT